MCSDVHGDKMLSMLHATDDDLPVASAHAHPHSRAVSFPSLRPDGARRGHTPHSLISRGGAVDVEALAPVHPRAGRRWSHAF
jgi:hypothetical protein